jgi:uncharacterized protein YdhG (YjbR/CyaY superfamily)
MSKAKSSTDGPLAKTRSAARSSKTATAAREAGADVEAYLARVPEPARTTLEKVRAAIRAAAPAEATEALSYGMPAFRYKGALVGYAAFKDHCSFFPMSATLLDDFKDELGACRTSKGTIQFPLDKPLPAALVKKIVKARVAENERKKVR